MIHKVEGSKQNNATRILQIIDEDDDVRDCLHDAQDWEHRGQRAERKAERRSVKRASKFRQRINNRRQWIDDRGKERLVQLRCIQTHIFEPQGVEAEHLTCARRVKAGFDNQFRGHGRQRINAADLNGFTGDRVNYSCGQLDFRKSLSGESQRNQIVHPQSGEANFLFPL